LAKETKTAKPKIELVQSDTLFDIDFCAPVKDKVQICGPNVVVKPCKPIMDIKCLPEMIGVCNPARVCIPMRHCLPETGSCFPMRCFPTRVCPPIIRAAEEAICAPSWGPPIEIPIEELINQLNVKIEALTREVQALAKR